MEIRNLDRDDTLINMTNGTYELDLAQGTISKNEAKKNVLGHFCFSLFNKDNDGNLIALPTNFTISLALKHIGNDMWIDVINPQYIFEETQISPYSLDFEASHFRFVVAGLQPDETISICATGRE